MKMRKASEARDLLKEGQKAGLVRLSDDGKRIEYLKHGISRDFSKPEASVEAKAYLSLILLYDYLAERIRLFAPVTIGYTIFVSMQFGSCGTEQNFKTIEAVVEKLNQGHALNPPLKIVRIDQLVTGETFEINEKIVNEAAQCGYLIADLTYCNSNVYHEIGILMGRTLALTGKHEYNMALIVDRQVSHESKIVKFNLQSLQHLAFSSQEELTNGIRARIEKFYHLK